MEKTIKITITEKEARNLLRHNFDEFVKYNEWKQRELKEYLDSKDKNKLEMACIWEKKANEYYNRFLEIEEGLENVEL